MKTKKESDRVLLPNDERIAELALLLVKQHKRDEVRNRYASVSRVLAFVGAGTVLFLSFFVAPGAIMLAKPFLDEKRRREQEEWKQFNPRYLRRTVARLREQKLVTVEEQGGQSVVVLTKNGKRRILKYSLDTLAIEKPKEWDGNWRLVIYDVPKRKPSTHDLTQPQRRGAGLTVGALGYFATRRSLNPAPVFENWGLVNPRSNERGIWVLGKKHLRDVFRQTLKGLGFYQLQESVWLHPYPCEKEVAFIREYHGVGNEVLYIVATRLEDDDPYRTYFGLS